MLPHCKLTFFHQADQFFGIHLAFLLIRQPIFSLSVNFSQTYEVRIRQHLGLADLNAAFPDPLQDPNA